MAADNEPDRLADIARGVWFGTETPDVRVYLGEEKAEVLDMPEGTVLISIRHPRAPRALEAVLKILNEDERVPLDVIDGYHNQIDSLRRSVDVLRNKYRTEKQKMEILRARLMECALSWEEEAPHQAAFLKHLIAHEFGP